MATKAKHLALSVGNNIDASGNVDSDTLDNLDSAQFLRSDADDLSSGRLAIKTGAQYSVGGNHELSLLNSMAIGPSNSDLVYFRYQGAAGEYAIQTYDSDNTGELHLQPYGGNVGIGTANPLQKLSVAGRVNIDQQEDYYGAWIDGDSTADSWFAVGTWYSNGGRMTAGANEGQGLHLYTHNAGHPVTLQKNGGQIAIGGADPFASRLQTNIGTSGIPDPSIALIPHGTSDARIDFLTSGRATNFYVGVDTSEDELKITGSQGFSVPALTINQSEHVKVWNYLVLSQSGLTVASLDSNAPTGSLAYVTDDGGNLWYKNGTAWKSFTSPLGTESNPAQSAQQILDAGDSVGDGVYWFKPAGYIGSAFQVYCDMTNFGGGWMIVSKWYQDAPYTVDEIYNANARNANTTYLLNGNQLTAKSTHARLSRDQMNALWNQSNGIARIWTTESSGTTGSPYGTFFQKKLTNVNNFDFWNAHYSARMWSDDITANGSYIQNPGSTYKVMRYETSGNIFTDNTFTDFTQPSVGNGPGWWDHVTVSAPNYGTIYVTRHMGFYGDIYTGSQWLLTNNPNDSRYTSQDSSEGKRTVVYLK